ncbi:hypothetical protein MKY30_16130 [Oceanobacillus sp. FSL W8-0428]|uniref:hypothetical protein n=1 Tax=Oceanobacillus sp. FSL W8-0428 TaxID=2921715 RepID=UPI0030F7C7D3
MSSTYSKLYEKLLLISVEQGSLSVSLEDLVNILNEHRWMTEYIDQMYVLNLYYRERLDNYIQIYSDEGRYLTEKQAFKDVLELYNNPYSDIEEILIPSVRKEWILTKSSELGLTSIELQNLYKEIKGEV